MSVLFTPTSQPASAMDLTLLALPGILILLALLVLRSFLGGKKAKRANENLLVLGLPLGIIFIVTIALRFSNILAR